MFHNLLKTIASLFKSKSTDLEKPIPETAKIITPDPEIKYLPISHEEAFMEVMDFIKRVFPAEYLDPGQAPHADKIGVIYSKIKLAPGTPIATNTLQQGDFVSTEVTFDHDYERVSMKFVPPANSTMKVNAFCTFTERIMDEFGLFGQGTMILAESTNTSEIRRALIHEESELPQKMHEFRQFASELEARPVYMQTLRSLITSGYCELDNIVRSNPIADRKQYEAMVYWRVDKADGAYVLTQQIITGEPIIGHGIKEEKGKGLQKKEVYKGSFSIWASGESATKELLAQISDKESLLQRYKQAIAKDKPKG